LTTDDKHIDSLIAKYLAGEATQEEQLQLRQWMDESEENKKYFGDIRFVHDKAVASHRYVKVDTEKAWSSVKAQMKGKNDPPQLQPKKKPAIYRTVWFRAAASLALIVGIAAIIYTLYKNPKQPELLTYSISSTDSTLTRTFNKTTQVVLNKNSKITFNHNRRNKTKELILSGEAYIQVKHSADTPLIVKAEETLIKDIGTSFNVKAYPGNSTIEVYVESGQVVFYTTLEAGINLTAGETGIYNRNTKSFRKSSTRNLNAISYTNHLFVFNHTRLAEVIDRLNSVYPESIVLENPVLEDCLLTVTFDHEAIDNIVDVIAETLGLRVRRTSNGYMLSGERCTSY
jgi:ferric-dicitrate binding protein FerR (iron transport regulator)